MNVLPIVAMVRIMMIVFTKKKFALYYLGALYLTPPRDFHLIQSNPTMYSTVTVDG